MPSSAVRSCGPPSRGAAGRAWVVAWAIALALGCGGTVAQPAAGQPAAEHQRAVDAYQRGDVSAALKLLRAPADAGHAPSQRLLAFILDRADVPDEAFRLYRSAAEQGDAEAHAALASFYAGGRGVAKDEKLALLHFSKAADLGDPLSINVVADAHARGTLGTAAVDATQSARAIRRAAEQNHPPAVEALAGAFTSGRFGIAPDGTQAAQWQARAEALRKQARATGRTRR